MKFGDIPKSDSCKDVSFQCVMDDAFLEQNESIKWFEATRETVLFYLTKDPINMSELN